jgi:hypothetical protein
MDGVGRGKKIKSFVVVVVLFCFIFSVLGLELRAFTLSHSTSPIFVNGFSR